jgi:transposase
MVKPSMNEIERKAVDDGPVVSEGGRSPSTLSTGHAASPAQSGAKLAPLASGQRWSAARKREVVLRLLRDESAELLSRELGLPIFKLEQWRRKADAALERALKGPGHCPGPKRTRVPASLLRPCSGSAS